MNIKENFEYWCTFDEDTKAELLSITDEKEIEDRFYKDLEFGTGGLRGVMGAGAYTSGGLTKCWSMWKYTLSNPEAASIKVVATDRFGRQYECSTITDGTDYSLVTKPTH